MRKGCDSLKGFFDFIFTGTSGLVIEIIFATLAFVVLIIVKFHPQ